VAFKTSNKKPIPEEELKQLLLAFLIGLVLATPGRAQSGESWRIQGLTTFEMATSAMVSWLKNVTMGPIDDIVAREKRAQLRNRLRELNQSIAELETSKERFLESLMGDDAQPHVLKAAEARKLVDQIQRVRDKVTRVKVLMREEYAIGGDKCEQLLESASGAQKMWAFRIADIADRDKGDPLVVEAIEKGKQAIKSLHEASLELAKLTRRLNE
jgi:hypothetical protein